MKISQSALSALYTGFKTVFNQSLEGAPSFYRQIAMVIPSSTEKEIYGWLGQSPAMREWVGDRVINQLSTHDFTITNKTFEQTVSVKRTQIEDDTYGILKPLFSHLGRNAALHPDTLSFGLLAEAYRMVCYDGQNFFDADHPVIKADGSIETVSNFTAGSGPAWFLLDTSQPLKPIIWQERIPYEFQSMDNFNDSHVFMRDEFIYGVRARGNAGLGLWQLAHMSRQPLTEVSFEAARSAMVSLKADHGAPLGVTPNVLVVPPALEPAARRLLKATALEASSNIWFGSAELIVSPYIS